MSSKLQAIAKVRTKIVDDKGKYPSYWITLGHIFRYTNSTSLVIKLSGFRFCMCTAFLVEGIEDLPFIYGNLYCTIGKDYQQYVGIINTKFEKDEETIKSYWLKLDIYPLKEIKSDGLWLSVKADEGE